ncbi:MAG: PfkB family carbohydrate kinase, partial [Chloroflexota bacterium]|nr:PfkB family carbohydrate kinase [Chloroflexota bacterium]
SYAARTAAAFGWKVAVVTSAHPDEPLLDSLRQYADVRVLPAAETTTYENIYTSAGRIQYIRARAETLTPDAIPADLLSAPMVHLGPIADEVPSAVAPIFTDATILATLQGWMRRWDADQRVLFKPFHDALLLRHANLIVFSEEDILAEPETEAWVRERARHTFVTRAERGGTYYHDGITESYPTPQVTVVEPTGAGDVFAAALLAALPLVSFNIRQATTIAARLASHSVTRPGLSGTPTADEVALALAGDLEADR